MGFVVHPNLLCDFYKISHREMYPAGTEVVYSTWTPRTSRLENVNKVVVFGLQHFIQSYLIDFFNEHFFQRDIDEITVEYQRVIRYTLGVEDPPVQHIRELHQLGFLPLAIKALPEGTLCPIRVPYMCIWNTHPKFFWLPNYIESLASCEMWQATTSATIAHQYWKLLHRYATETGDPAKVPFQAHDFSMRGMGSLEAAIKSGMGHLVSFVGTDTIPAILAAEYYYDGDISKQLIGTSIPASEHSIQCSYDSDLDYIRTLITEIHPTGLVSVVIDGYDFWGVIENVLPQLKEAIMARDGTVVFRGDSGNPVDITAGSLAADAEPIVAKGAVEALYDLFGGTVNSKGYKELDPHVGFIYGDSITLARCEEICARLKAKQFATTNTVFGIGSYTYQYNTRDTFGFALKTTFNIQNGRPKLIYKDPKTDDGTKRSLRGIVAVYERGGEYVAVDGATEHSRDGFDQLQVVFSDGRLLVKQSFAGVRQQLIDETAPKYTGHPGPDSGLL